MSLYIYTFITFYVLHFPYWFKLLLMTKSYRNLLWWRSLFFALRCPSPHIILITPIWNNFFFMGMLSKCVTVGWWSDIRWWKKLSVWAKKRNNNSQLKKRNPQLTPRSIDWWLPWYTFNVTQSAFCCFFLSMIDTLQVTPQGLRRSTLASNKIYCIGKNSH